MFANSTKKSNSLVWKNGLFFGIDSTPGVTFCFPSLLFLCLYLIFSQYHSKHVHWSILTLFFILKQWKALDMTRSERRKILCSVSFHVIAITCVVWSLWVLIERTAEEIREGQLDWPFWTKLVVVAIGFTGGLVFMYVQCKVYVQLWRRLRAFNRIILVKDVPQEGPENI